jgi:hypothetical protein
LTSTPPAHDAFLTTEEVLEYLRTRVLLTKMLERDYDVETAIDGPNALAVLRKAGAIHDLMISDLTMPGAIDAVNLRVAGYLTKPLRDSQVLEAAARALGAPVA